MSTTTSTKRLVAFSVCLVASLLVTSVFARGFRGGGRVGGAGGRSMPARTPSMSRVPSRQPASRPALPQRPAASRPGTGQRAGAGNRGGGQRPGAGQRPAGDRPSRSDLQNFLDLKPGDRPGTGARPGGDGVAGNNAAADFLRNNTSGTTGDRPNVADRPTAGDRNRPNTGDRSNVGNRPDRIDNREERRNQRTQRRQEVRDQVRDNHPRFDFWSDHPDWARWRLNRPYRWATWAAVTGWFPWGWSNASSYSYGENIYYQDDSVYYGDQAVATADEYAQQAQTLAASAGDVPADTKESDWLSLGVFAITQDGTATGPAPTMFVQLQVNKAGLVTGTFQNMANGDVQQIDGAVDKNTQRTAWTIKDQNWPVMECGISNLAEDQTPALVHFENGQTQQWLLFRVEDPDAAQQ